MITQEQFNAALDRAGFKQALLCLCGGFIANGYVWHSTSCAEAARTRSEPPAERRDCDEMPLGVPRG